MRETEPSTTERENKMKISDQFTKSQIDLLKTLASCAVANALFEINSIERDDSQDDQWQADVIREQLEELCDIRSKLERPEKRRMCKDEKYTLRSLVQRESNRLMVVISTQGGDGPERAKFDSMCHLYRALGGWA